MRVLVFNDTEHTWKKHAAGRGPEEILPHSGATIELYNVPEHVFVKVWKGMFLVQGITDEHFAKDVGESVGAMGEEP